MDFEDERVCEFADVVEAPLGAKLIGAGDAGFAQRQDYAGEQRKKDEGGRCHADFVTQDIFSATVGKRALARQDRQAFQMATDILRELVSGTVAFVRLLANRLQHDVV